MSKEVQLSMKVPGTRLLLLLVLLNPGVDGKMHRDEKSTEIGSLVR